MLPYTNFLSAPLWLVELLNIVTLTLHFAAMNFMVGGVVIILFGKFDDKWNNPVVQKFIKMFPNAMAATVSFGVAPLLFIQLVFHHQMYSASIVSGWFWLMIVVAVIIAYYFLYATSFSKKTNGRQKVYLSIALVCMIYVSYIYSSVFSMMEKPDLYAALYAGDQAGTIINPEIGSYLSRWLHMLLGAVTVGAYFVGLLGKDNEKAFTIGKNFYLWGMVAAMTLGFVYMLTLGDFLKPFMHSIGIWTVTISFILSLGSLHFFFKKRFLPAGIMLFVSLISMVTTRHIVRLIHLKDFYDPATMKVAPQWSIFIIFLILFVIMVAVVWYMLKLYFGKQE